MIPAGIVDPTKVTRTALENAASIASCVLTTESLVADSPILRLTQLGSSRSTGRRHGRHVLKRTSHPWLADGIRAS